MPYKRKYNKKKKPTTKNQRRNYAKTIQPYIEIKNKETEGQYALSSTNLVHIPDCFEFMRHGDTASSMDGRWIFSKWLKQKMLIDWTDNNTDHLPVTYKMTQGWCKINLNPLPDVTTPQNPIPCEQDALQQHVFRYLVAAYEDDLAFGDKRRFKIIKTKFIHSNPRILEQTDGTAVCFRQNIRLNLEWTPMRKIRYNACVDAAGTSFMQCNTKNWVPFVFWQKNPAGNTESGSYPVITQTSKHWFTDS